MKQIPLYRLHQPTQVQIWIIFFDELTNLVDPREFSVNTTSTAVSQYTLRVDDTFNFSDRRFFFQIFDSRVKVEVQPNFVFDARMF